MGLTYDELVKREASFAELARAAAREGRGPDFRARLDRATRVGRELYITPRHQRGPRAQPGTALAAVRSHDIGELLRVGYALTTFQGTRGWLFLDFGEGAGSERAYDLALAHYGGRSPGFLAIQTLDRDR